LVITFFTVGLISLNNKSANGFANNADVVATTAIDAVVDTVSMGGRYTSTHDTSG
tara:strand:+ start:5458 stop:5622 length:165 start_codon:yes stop_codon:yes gene_type:complete